MMDGIILVMLKIKIINLISILAEIVGYQQITQAYSLSSCLERKWSRAEIIEKYQ